MVDSSAAKAILETLGRIWPEQTDLSGVEMEDSEAQGLVVTVLTSTPGRVIGPGGSRVKAVRDHLRAAVPDRTVDLRVHEVASPGRPVGGASSSGGAGEGKNRLTDRAQRVLVLAREEAGLLNHGFIGTEHILLGLLHEGEGIAANALASLGITLTGARAQVAETVPRGASVPNDSPPFMPRAKKVLELSLRESLQLGHSYIGTEHMLLGIVREGEGVGAQVLPLLGADLGRVRQRVIQIMSGYWPTQGDA